MRTSSAASDSQPDTRERILEAALVCFAQDGYDGATMRDIAARARVPQGLLRNHFGGKLKLWQASLDMAFADIRIVLDAPRDDAAVGGDDL